MALPSIEPIAGQGGSQGSAVRAAPRPRSRRDRSPHLAVVAALACAAWLACQGDLAPRVRSHTYPPDFRYLETEEIRSTMWQLASLVAQLDRAMETRERDAEAGQREALRVLKEMHRVSATLGSGGTPSNHPRVSVHIERFRADVDAARRDLEREPPAFYRAGRVSGSCLHCHGRE